MMKTFKRGSVLLTLTLLAGLLPLILVEKPANAATLPAGFEDQYVASVGAPTALAFTPDDRMLVASQPGRLGVYDQNGTALAVPALDISAKTCSNSERGLLGVAVDPNFGTNNYVYVYYTFNRSGTCVNRVSRFTLPDNNAVDSTSELVLVDNIPSPYGNHNAGDLRFGQDGNLYVSVGDGGGGPSAGGVAAQSPASLLGKILRVKPDGTAPAGNPYVSSGVRCSATGGAGAGQQCQEIFASGLRNPFRFAFRPGTDEFFINDVGQGTWEEIDAGQANANYGWPTREGPCAYGSTTDCGPSGFTAPIHAYAHTTGCRSITGGAFVPAGVWGAGYEGAYLFGDFVCGKIFGIFPDRSVREFASGLGSGSAVHLTFGPYRGTQALYYTTYAGGGQVHRITYTGQGDPALPPVYTPPPNNPQPSPPPPLSPPPQPPSPTPPNSGPPRAEDDLFKVKRGGKLSVRAPGVLTNDSDGEGAELTAVLVSGPKHGKLTLNVDGSFTYKPRAKYSGKDSFTYTAASDGGTRVSEEARVEITVKAGAGPKKKGKKK